ncbi:hypothetical protein F5B21DRAFT_489217 [Xylaria acuta]|nr:hypothetical protein F5B21DRAFT_489217 [Xylaria acuta]
MTISLLLRISHSIYAFLGAFNTFDFLHFLHLHPPHLLFLCFPFSFLFSLSHRSLTHPNVLITITFTSTVVLIILYTLIRRSGDDFWFVK